MTFAEAFKGALTARGWSQHQAARITGLSRGQIAHWCTGNTSPVLGDLERVAEAFGVVFVCSAFGWACHRLPAETVAAVRDSDGTGATT